MKTLFVTGATGFIGLHVVPALLKEGWKVRALVRNPTKAKKLPEEVIRIWGNLENPESLQKGIQGVDVIVHIAGLIKARTREDFFRINRDGAAHIAKIAASQDPPPYVILISSQAAGGPSIPGKPRKETDPPQPVSPYGKSKLEGERVLQENLSHACILRLAAVYGPYDKETLPFFRWAKKGWLPRLSSPRQTLQMIYCADVVRYILACLQSKPEGIFHIAHPEILTWREVVHTLEEVVQRKIRSYPVPGIFLYTVAFLNTLLGKFLKRAMMLTPSKVKELTASSWVMSLEKTQSVINFEPCYPFKRGSADTYQWYVKNGWL